jgi:hypothetical protein
VVNVRGHQTGRILPLAFAGLAVVLGYWFARRLPWGRREAATSAGLLGAMAALLVPSMLIRNDLKQYTADAALALAALIFTANVERDRSRRSLIVLSISVWGGMLLSHTMAFVGAAAFIAIVLVALVRRAWGTALESAIAGVLTAALMLVVYEVFDARAVIPALKTYWQNYYLPTGKGHSAAPHFLHLTLDELRPDFGLGPLWIVAMLFLAGLITLVVLGRPATALTALALWPEMIVLSAAKRYPFGDARTSTFLVVVTVVVAAIGVAGLGALLRRWGAFGLNQAVVMLAVALFALQSHPYVRSHLIPHDTVRDQANYVHAHAAPNDVVVVSMGATWNMADYWPTGHLQIETDPHLAQGLPALTDQPQIIDARDRTAPAVALAFDQALDRANARPGIRIWIIYGQPGLHEATYWAQAVQDHGLQLTPIGPVGLTVVTLP